MFVLQFSGELLADEDPMFLAIQEFDIAGNEMIVPVTHLIFKVVPFVRYMPGYYGNLYRRTIKSREDLRIELINRMKVCIIYNTQL